MNTYYSYNLVKLLNMAQSNILRFPMKKMAMFHSSWYVYQMETSSIVRTLVETTSWLLSVTNPMDVDKKLTGGIPYEVKLLVMRSSDEISDEYQTKECELVLILLVLSQFHIDIGQRLVKDDTLW